MTKSYMATANTVEHKWFVIDATDLVLGRASSEIASLLRGKGKPTYTPNVDCGDNVIIINAEKIAVTGKKMEEKFYYHASSYPGGLKTRSVKEMLEKQPQKVLELAIRGMLPKSKLGDDMYRRLYVYVGPEHPHQAQKPEVYVLKG